MVMNVIAAMSKKPQGVKDGADGVQVATVIAGIMPAFLEQRIEEIYVLRMAARQALNRRNGLHET